MMLKKRNLRTRVVVATVGAVAAFSLAACGSSHPGQAAVVGGTSIAEGELTAEVEQVASALQIDPNVQVNRIILQRMVLEDLVNTLAAEHSITVNDGEIQARITEAAPTPQQRAQFDDALLRNGIPSESVNDAVRMTLQLQYLGDKLAPGKSEEEKQMAVSLAAVNLAGQEQIEINPRFGIWDQASLQIAPTPDTVSEPALVNDAGLNLVPQ